ncbi:MAG TPA: hypothetical protein VK864_09120 [Longimicrobiales bacterium]|nr:hypothetical protein [Longimicrobiales bacterium]
MLLLGTTQACAYFNSLYNANRVYADAERARARGDSAAAHTAYRSAIHKANRSLVKHPRSRWSDDAQLLIARAHLALGELDSARIAFAALLQRSSDSEMRGTAQIQLAALDAHGGLTDAALARLDSALAAASVPDATMALGHFTRARLLAASGRANAATTDLEAARKRADDPLRAEIALLEAQLAIAAHDSVATRAAVHSLLRNAQAEVWTDSVQSMARTIATAFSTELARELIALAADSPWRVNARDSLLFFGAELALQNGDTAEAITAMEKLAGQRTGRSADLARLRAAEWRLARASSLGDLDEVRALALPALALQRAQLLVHNLRTLAVLVERANRTGQPLVLFAAAELARDELRAPRLAYRLFLSYVDLAPQTVWAPKALLAASALAAPERADSIRQRLVNYADNPYVSALEGRGDPDQFASSEDRLNRVLTTALKEAAVEARRQENSVGRAVALMDSMRAAARMDSTRVSCGILLDSLAVTGIRADSIQSACLRGERDRVATLIRIDTLLLRDTAKLRADSARAKTRARKDTAKVS